MHVYQMFVYVLCCFDDELVCLSLNKISVLFKFSVHKRLPTQTNVLSDPDPMGPSFGDSLLTF